MLPENIIGGLWFSCGTWYPLRIKLFIDYSFWAPFILWIFYPIWLWFVDTEYWFLSFSEFLVSQNPTWTFGTPSYVSEIALLDENEDILVMSKLQSPVLRQGIQQYVIKLDF